MGFDYVYDDDDGPIEMIKHLKEEGVAEAWSEKYKRSINCDNPRGLSQRAHCKGRNKK